MSQILEMKKRHVTAEVVQWLARSSGRPAEDIASGVRKNRRIFFRVDEASFAKLERMAAAWGMNVDEAFVAWIVEQSANRRAA